MGIDSRLKVRAEKGRMFGKWILRRAFKDLLPESILWSIKAPVEVGTGTASLPAYFDTKISDGDFDLKKDRYLKLDRVKLRSKEHLVYYEIFRNCFGVPGRKGSAGRTCPECQRGVEVETTFCRVCGAYPV
jgi:asparagine synthase (glutamine-hydrolysing)